VATATSFAVSELTQAGERLGLRLLAGGAGTQRLIASARVQLPGIVLAGHPHSLREGRVQVLGEEELGLLQRLPREERVSTLDELCRRPIPCFVVTADQEVVAELVAACEQQRLPLLRTALPTRVAVARLETWLEDRMAPATSTHGVLMDVFGLGALLTGPSGIGKSECGLELIARGHRLVADDVVDIRRYRDKRLVGSAPPLLRHQLEIRGLGVLDARQLYGLTAIRAQKQVELVVDLQPGTVTRELDRLVFEPATTEILEIAVPLVTIPVMPGRNLAVLVEVAARDQLARRDGHRPAPLFSGRRQD
jgi:HPr kinase/phosphorylase